MLEGGVLVALRGHADGVAEDSGPGLESRDVGSDGYDLTGDIMAKDGGVVEWPPGEGLEAAVDGVDGDGVVSNEDFVFGWGPKRGGLDLEGSAFRSREPGGGVGGHGERACRVCGGSKVGEKAGVGW